MSDVRTANDTPIGDDATINSNHDGKRPRNKAPKIRPYDLAPSPPEGSPVQEFFRVLGYRDGETIAVCADGYGRFETNFRSVAEVSTEEIDPNRNVYFSVSTFPKGTTNDRTIDNARRLKVLWCDLDVKDGALPDLGTAERVVTALEDVLDVPAAAIVYSGTGIHAYWRVHSLRSSSTRLSSDNRAQLASLVARWGGLVKSIVRSLSPGAAVDNVYDLARIMRLPGSYNQKTTPAKYVPVELAAVEDRDSKGRAPGVTLQRLKSILREYDAQPLSNTRAHAASRARSRGQRMSPAEVEAIVNSIPGADADPTAQLRKIADPNHLIARFTSGEVSVHEEMVRLVFRVVRLSMEGEAGLAWALESIQFAFKETFARRGSPIYPSVRGEDRSGDADAEFFHALEGAISKSVNHRPMCLVTRSEEDQ